MDMFVLVIEMLDSTLRLSTPLIFACLAGLFSERAGIVDIGLEGKMLAAAFLAGAVAFATGNIWLGTLAGVGGSLALALVHGFASITARGDQLISGVAINFLASGITVVVGTAWFGLGGRTPNLPESARFDKLGDGLGDAIMDVPVVGPVIGELLLGHAILVYVAVLVVPLSWFVLYRTRFGLRLRAVGENPSAVDTAGVSVVRLRYMAVIIAGLLCGLAGVYLASLAAGFVKEMSAGRGFIALAALIFAKWRPWYAMAACFLFGFLEAFSNRFQSIEIGSFVVPVQFMQALPFILTVIILAGFVGRAIPPRAGGTPYVKER